MMLLPIIDGTLAGKPIKQILTVKQWLELKECEIYQRWYNENVAPGNVIPSDVPDEILNLKTLTPEGDSKQTKIVRGISRIQKLDKWLSETDDGV